MPCDQCEAKPKDTELIPTMQKISGPKRQGNCVTAGGVLSFSGSYLSWSGIL